MEYVINIILASLPFVIAIILAIPFPSDKKRIRKFFERKGYFVTKIEWDILSQKTFFHNLHTFRVIYKGNDGTIYKNYAYTSWVLGRVLTDEEMVKYKKKSKTKVSSTKKPNTEEDQDGCGDKRNTN